MKKQKEHKKAKQRDPIALLMHLRGKGGAMKDRKKEKTRLKCRKKVSPDE